MTFPARTREGVTILEPAGKITIGRGDIELRDSVDEAMEAGSNQLVMDFKRVTRMDSSGMAELVAAYKRITESGADEAAAPACQHSGCPGDYPDRPGIRHLRRRR